MKISTEQIAATQKSELQQKKVQPHAEGFESFFMEQLSEKKAQGVAPGIDSDFAAMQGLVTSQLAGQIVGQAGEVADSLDAEILQQVAAQMETIFAGLEEYSTQMGNAQNNSLRDAYASLDTMNKEIASLKIAHPQLQKQSPELAGIMNELEVLATTETFKFNRGDYL